MYQLVRSAQSRVDTTQAAMMRVPPMVGVPALVRWASGPSLPYDLPHLHAGERARITAGPRTKAMRSAVTSAPAALNVL